MDRNSGTYDYQAYRILQFAFIVAPIIAGLDKFFYFLTNWSRYLSPMALQFLQGNERFFMMAVGVVEVIVGIGMIFKPKVFSYIVALWLLGIIINLLMHKAYYDVALRDLGLMLAALALGRLSHKYSEHA